MESMVYQKNKRLSQLNRIPFSLKLASNFLTSLLLFTVLLTCFSLLPVIFKTVEFFTLINKNYVFLVCNGLLVFIVKNSGLITNSHTETSPSTMKETQVRNHLKKTAELAEPKTEKVAGTKKPIRELHEMEEKSQIMVVQVEESVLVTVTEEAVESHEENNGVVDEEEGDESIESLSAEELRKKCEDFIRKMKQGIRMQSQQLVSVQ